MRLRSALIQIVTFAFDWRQLTSLCGVTLFERSRELTSDMHGNTRSNTVAPNRVAA